MAAAWKEYEEAAGALFRSLGMDAELDTVVSGARGQHSVDVYVTFTVGGVTISWVVECKHWKSRVTKLHVLALSQIVQDVGADRGILLSETGFQAGAIQSARHTNITLSSLEDLREIATGDLHQVRLENLIRRKNLGRRRLHRILFNEYPEAGIARNLDEDRIVELLAGWFGLEMALNKASIQDLPVSFAGLDDSSPFLSYGNIEDALDAMAGLADQIELHEKQITEHICRRAEVVLADTHELLALSEQAVLEAEKVLKLPLKQRAEGDALRPSLAIMESIGRVAERLKSNSAGRVRQAAHELWGILIHTIFQYFTDESVAPEEWTSATDALRVAQTRLTQSLQGSAEAEPTKTPPPATP